MANVKQKMDIRTAEYIVDKDFRLSSASARNAGQLI